MKQALPTTNGFGSVIANVGKVSNKGVEVLLNTINITNKNLIWTTSINFTKNKNRLEELPNGAKYGWSGNTGPENVLAVGYPLKGFLQYQHAGIWQLADSAEAKDTVKCQVRYVLLTKTMTEKLPQVLLVKMIV